MKAVVYTSKTCAPCSSLKKYLDHKGIEYELRDIEMPRWAHIVNTLTGRVIVPVTVLNGHIITGLNYSAIAKAIDEPV